MIKVVIFDIGDTLFFTKTIGQAVKKLADLKALNSFGYNFSKKDYYKARAFMQKKFKKIPEKQKQSKNNKLIYGTLTMQGLGLKPKKHIVKKMRKAYEAELLKQAIAIPNSLKILKALKKKKLILAILSNAYSDFGKRYLKKFGYNKYFSQVLISCDIGYRKSQIKPFHILLKKLNKNRKHKIKPAECLMVGNNVKEDAAAKQVGMKVAILKPMIEDKHLLKKLKPDYLIKDLWEVKKIVEES
ncbi:MAG: HAD family hydrolase [archaeon]|nr:HAD family hydrolase [archaeon]